MPAGYESKIYVGAAGAELSALTELTNSQDLTVTDEMTETNKTTRANGGLVSSGTGLRKITAEFTMIKDGGADYETIRQAYAGRTLLTVAFLSGDKATSGTFGHKGQFRVLNFSASDPLDEETGVTVSLTLDAYDEYVEVA